MFQRSTLRIVCALALVTLAACTTEVAARGGRGGGGGGGGGGGSDTGTIDTDATMDEWIISTQSFSSSCTADLGNKASGEPVNGVNDVNN